MAITEERREQISQLRQAHQEALNALLKMRLEGQNGQALGGAVERAQRAANMLFAARLDDEFERRAASKSPPPASQESTEEVSAAANA